MRAMWFFTFVFILSSTGASAATEGFKGMLFRNQQPFLRIEISLDLPKELRANGQPQVSIFETEDPRSLTCVTSLEFGNLTANISFYEPESQTQVGRVHRIPVRLALSHSKEVNHRNDCNRPQEMGSGFRYVGLRGLGSIRLSIANLEFDVTLTAANYPMMANLLQVNRNYILTNIRINEDPNLNPRFFWHLFTNGQVSPVESYQHTPLRIFRK